MDELQPPPTRNCCRTRKRKKTTEKNKQIGGPPPAPPLTRPVTPTASVDLGEKPKSIKGRAAPTGTALKAPNQKVYSGQTHHYKYIFNHYCVQLLLPNNVTNAYSKIRKTIGGVGGDGSNGPIYGENTMDSVHGLFNEMKKLTNFGPESRFLDVGSGAGKPNIHAMCDPAVAFSAGIESEATRCMLSDINLKAVMSTDYYKCAFVHQDATELATFNGFTHVFMFSIGFPPSLWGEILRIWENSTTPYLVCYTNLTKLNEYGFRLELLGDYTTAMFGGKEKRKAFIYRRPGKLTEPSNTFDPVFQTSWDTVQSGGYEATVAMVDRQVNAAYQTNRLRSQE